MHAAMLTWQECYDLVALLLMIRMNYHHQLIMNKRRIPCLDDYLDRVNLLIWPRFKVRAPLPRACSHAHFGWHICILQEPTPCLDDAR